MNRSGRRMLAAAAFAASLVAVDPGAWAHHSFSAFNRAEAAKRTITGTVKEYSFTNPHGWLKIAVAEPGNKTSNWSFEMASVVQLTRHGWSPKSLVHGDKVSVTYFPLRFGSYGGQVIQVGLPDGKVLQGLAEADRGYPKP